MEATPLVLEGVVAALGHKANRVRYRIQCGFYSRWYGIVDISVKFQTAGVAPPLAAATTKRSKTAPVLKHPSIAHHSQ